MALGCVEVRKVLKGKVVRFNMDSRAAIANLVHSGPVSELGRLAQEIWKVLWGMDITPSFRWLSREVPQLVRVDAMSKEVSFSLSKTACEEYESRFGRRVLSVNHNELEVAIARVLVGGVVCAFLVPKLLAYGSE